MDDSLNALEYYKSVSKTNRIARNSLGVQPNRSIKSPIPGFSPLVTDKKAQYHTTTQDKTIQNNTFSHSRQMNSVQSSVMKLKRNQIDFSSKKFDMEIPQRPYNSKHINKNVKEFFSNRTQYGSSSQQKQPVNIGNQLNQSALVS